jgi:hypothetical protein
MGTSQLAETLMGLFADDQILLTKSEDLYNTRHTSSKMAAEFPIVINTSIKMGTSI